MIQLEKLSSPVVKKLVEEYRKRKIIYQTKAIYFCDVDGKDIYNISCPLMWQGKEYILGRIESRNSEISQVGIFELTGELEYHKLISTIPLLQDPFYSFIDNQLFIGGTEIYLNQNDKIISWATSFYVTSDLKKITRVLVAPNKMKDVRIFNDKEIHVFTRPQGGLAKLGRIGHLTINNLSEFSQDLLTNAELLNNQFDEYSWGGVNQVLKLKNGLLGILGHIACMSKGNVRHYFGMTFTYNPKTKEHLNMKIICERSDFVKGEAKRPDLHDVVFPGGIVRKDDEKAILYAGLSDVSSAILKIDDPFIEYEK